MPERTVQLSTAQTSAAVANFTIGLVKLVKKGNVEDAICAGSGTLSNVGDLYGFLTAAHVLEALPVHGDVGIVLYRERTFQKQVIKMENTERLVIRAAEFGPDGPDLGFLRIPNENLGWLKATSSFYNLSKRRDEFLAGETPASNHVDAVIGLIEELTQEARVPNPERRAKVFSALFCNGEIRERKTIQGYDLFNFLPTAYSDFKLPASFEGMSGGALWRVYFDMKDDKPIIVGQRLYGIPFYQLSENDGIISIICHGPDGIYKVLTEKIKERWPLPAEGAMSPEPST